MARRIKLGFNGSGDSNGAAVASKASKGANTNSFTQSTSSKKPTAKSRGNAHATLHPGVTSISCDGGDVMSLASTESLSANGVYTIIAAWTNADYTNDTWLVSGTSNDMHWGIDAGGAGLIFKANGSKAAAAERDYRSDNTNDSTISYTFGSDVEMVAIVVDASSASITIDIYNIDGDKIATDEASGSSVTSGLAVALNIDHVIGKSDGTLGLNGELLDIAIYNTVLPVNIIAGKGNKYKGHKN